MEEAEIAELLKHFSETMNEVKTLNGVFLKLIGNFPWHMLDKINKWGTIFYTEYFPQFREHIKMYIVWVMVKRISILGIKGFLEFYIIYLNGYTHY